MPIPESVRQADVAGLRQLLAAERRRTRKRGFVGSPVGVDTSGDELSEAIRRELRPGAAWLKTLDPNVATEVAYPAVEPLVARMTEVGRWALLKLTLLESPAPDDIQQTVEQFDSRQKPCDDATTPTKPRRNLKPVARQPTSKTGSLYQLSGPSVDAEQLFAAAQVEILALEESVVEIVQRTVDVANNLTPDTATGQTIATRLSALADRHHLIFSRAGQTGMLVFVPQRRAAGEPGKFALETEAGVQPLEGGLSSLVVSRSDAATTNLSRLRRCHERETLATMTALVFGDEAPSRSGFRQYLADLAGREAKFWTPAARLEVVQILNYWKHQLNVQFFYDGEGCNLKAKDRGRRGFQLRALGNEQPTIYTGLQLPKIAVRAAR